MLVDVTAEGWEEDADVRQLPDVWVNRENASKGQV